MKPLRTERWIVWRWGGEKVRAVTRQSAELLSLASLTSLDKVNCFKDGHVLDLLAYYFAVKMARRLREV